MVTTLSSRDFNQKTGIAKKATCHGPVIITERGRPSHVLLTYEAYAKLRERDDRTILDLLACPDAAALEFEIPRRDTVSKDLDFS